MLAHHPVTGQPIRILRSDVQVSRDLRTLVWIRPSFHLNSRWARWSTIISEPEAVTALNGECPTVIILRSYSDAWKPIFHKFLHKESEVLVIGTRKTLGRMNSDLGFEWTQSLACEDLFDAYPFLGEPIKPEDPIEKFVVSIAHILRFQRIAWMVSEIEERSTTAAQLRAWKKCCNGALLKLPEHADATKVIPECWLIQQYFKHSLPKRAREIWSCLEKNIECPYIDRILLLNETDTHELPKSDKLQVKVVGSRLTYADVLRAIKTDVPDGAYVVFSNSDIWFDTSLSSLWSISLKERKLFLALLRWEESGEIFGPRADSQDSWILAKDTVNFEITDEEFGFPFGKPGCDNAISVEMLRKKFLIVNPAYTIKSHHVHSSNIRNYDPQDILYKPMYMYIDPSAIQVYRVENDMKQFVVPMKNTSESFTRPIGFVNETHAKTVCTMLNRKDEISKFEVLGKNIWTPPSEFMYHMKQPVFMTSNGLLSDFNTLYLGGNKEWQAKWENVQVSTLTPAIHVPTLLSVSTDDNVWKTLSEWVLHYVPSALKLRSVDSHVPEFLVPSLPEISPFLYDCIWAQKHITAIPYMEDTQYYTNNMYCIPPVKNCQVTKEDIQLLRNLLPTPKQIIDKRPVLVFLVSKDTEGEPAICSKGWVEETVNCLFSDKTKWDVRILTHEDSHKKMRETLQEANWIFGEGEQLNWMWMAARPGVCVMEFMKETAITSDRIHLAGAAGHTYVLGFVRKEPIEFQRQHALLDVNKAIQKYGFKEALSTSVIKKDLPVITIPHGKALEGIWNHTGDTFREIVEIWKDREYCTVERSEDTHYCWWGGIGEVLLYDRPTPRWWNREKVPNYQMAMFGNCPPPGPQEQSMRQSVWSFWARSPRALEDKVGKGIPGWDERSTQSIFLGKVENGIQQKRRCDVDWSKSVEVFSMPIDSTGKAYPYTQSEYLEKLCNAKFGLCLPGFGFKCNREIEYFACGVVPIVADDVDMTNYLVAPKEGVHYFRARIPEDVKKIVESTSREKWEAMSLAGYTWWRENASAEGLFRLTWARIEQCRPFFHVGIPKNFTPQL